MRKSCASLLLLSMLSAATGSFAAEKMKPGLWEMKMKSDHMMNIPKEQMEQMRKMGINVPQIEADGIVTKLCVTKQMAEADQPPGMDKNEMGCKTKNFQRSGNAYSMDIICNGQGMSGEGKVKGAFSNSENMTSTYDFKGVMHGQPVNQHHETTGKWLAADCGSVKPVGEMMPRK